MKLTDVQKRSVFKSLANKSQHATGLEFGFDKHYKSNTAIVNAVNKVYRQVKENPERYAVSPELVDMVESGMQTRRTLGNAANETGLATVAEQAYENLDTKSLVISAKKKSWIILNKMLDKTLKSRKALNKESMMAIAKIAGITFDKGQIVQGEATEHIALRAKIDPTMSVEEMLQQMIHVKRAQDGGDDE